MPDHSPSTRTPVHSICGKCITAQRCCQTTTTRIARQRRVDRVDTGRLFWVVQLKTTYPPIDDSTCRRRFRGGGMTCPISPRTSTTSSSHSFDRKRRRWLHRCQGSSIHRTRASYPFWRDAPPSPIVACRVFGWNRWSAAERDCRCRTLCSDGVGVAEVADGVFDSGDRRSRCELGILLARRYADERRSGLPRWRSAATGSGRMDCIIVSTSVPFRGMLLSENTCPLFDCVASSSASHRRIAASSSESGGHIDRFPSYLAND